MKFRETVSRLDAGLLWLSIIGGVSGCAAVGISSEKRVSEPVEETRAGSGSEKDALRRSQAAEQDAYAPFRAFGRLQARTIWGQARHGVSHGASGALARFRNQARFDRYARHQVELTTLEFFKGRYNRSRARLPENIDDWRGRPDIANPGPDQANFPNSPFTLPQDRVYVELAPFTYTGATPGGPEEYNTQFLLRYGVTENIELRVFGDGVTWTGGSDATSGFSPIGFDTKILLWAEKPDDFVPAVGFEATVQTEWLGSSAFNSGTQPTFTLNFDQSLPFEIDFGYSFSAMRFQNADGENAWALNFQWAFQHDLFDNDFAVFAHGYLTRSTDTQNAVGGGFVWTVNRQFAVYGQAAGGTTRSTPALQSNVGFAVAF